MLTTELEFFRGKTQFLERKLHALTQAQPVSPFTQSFSAPLSAPPTNSPQIPPLLQHPLSAPPLPANARPFLYPPPSYFQQGPIQYNFPPQRSFDPPVHPFGSLQVDTKKHLRKNEESE